MIRSFAVISPHRSRFCPEHTRVSLFFVFLLPGVDDAISNLLKPTGISPGCTTFLHSLDADPSFSCLTNLVSILSDFVPVHTPASPAALTSALDSLCSATSCGSNNYRTHICGLPGSNKLVTAPNQAVVEIHDALYTLKPVKDAICLKNESGRYSVIAPTVSSTTISSSSASSAAPAASPSTGTNTTAPCSSQ